MRSGGVQGRSEGFIGGQGRSRKIREVRVGQERLEECRRGQEVREVRECEGRLWNLWEVRGVLKTSVCSDYHNTFMKPKGVLVLFTLEDLLLD